MTIHDEDVHTAPVWGAPVPPAEVPPTGPGGAGPAGSGRKRMSPRAKTLTAVGVAAVVAVGGTVAVTAANSSSAGSAQTGSGQGGPGGGFGGGAGNAGGGFGRQGDSAVGALTSALHGQFVISGTSGSTTTEQIQTGTVSAVSSTSLSVKSTDGFTGTYVVGSVDVSAATVGTSVTVLATVSGNTLNLVSARTSSSTAANANGAGPPA